MGITLLGGAVVCGGGLVLVQFVEVEVEQSRRLVGILVVEWHETVTEIERDGCGVGIDGYETATLALSSLST